MSYPTPSRESKGPVGDGNYTVREGDCLESIAFAAGHSWQAIWNHPQNAALKKARISPNILLTGDRLYIPDKVLKSVDCSADQTHTFIRQGVPCKLRLCLKRVGEPLSNQPYRLVIDGTLFEGKTDGEGWIEIAIPPDASEGRLTVGEASRLQEVYSLTLGDMDPITEPLGIQKRLRNLGFPCELTGTIDDNTSTAIALFQKGEGLEPTGEVGSTTLEKLKARCQS